MKAELFLVASSFAKNVSTPMRLVIMSCSIVLRATRSNVSMREREEQVRFRFGFILGRSIIAAEEEADSQQQGADASHVQASHWLDEHLDKLLLLLLLFRFDARYVDRE